MQEYNYACKDCRKHTQGKDINKNYEQKYASESLFLNIRDKHNDFYSVISSNPITLTHHNRWFVSVLSSKSH